MISIITDSAADLLQVVQKERKIKVIPMPINFGDKQYFSGENISNPEFYAKLKAADKLPTTSMINSYTFKDAIEKELSKGNDVVLIVISSKLSLTYEQAVIAAKETNSKKVFVVDSLNAAMGEGALVLEATRLRDEGKTAKQIYEELNKLIPKLRVLAVVDTLKYLKAGGRISGTKAIVGTLLNIKPIISVENGKVIDKAKAIGKNNAYKQVASMVGKLNVDTDKNIVIAHACDGTLLNEFSNVIKNVCKIAPTVITEIGSTIGVHVGPGAVGIAFFEE